MTNAQAHNADRTTETAKGVWSLLKLTLVAFPFRFAITLSCLVLGKVATIAVAFVLKAVVDFFNAGKATYIPIALLLSYGALRLASSVFTQLRELLFERVLRFSVREAALKTFAHLHALSLRFHLNRQTGGVLRDIERGKNGIYNVFGHILFNVLPTAIEIALVTAFLLAKFDVQFALVILATMGLYVALTVVLTEWRSRLLRSVHVAETSANARAVDSILNAETVKHFARQAAETHVYEGNLVNVDQLALRAELTRGAVNFGQNVLTTVALTTLLFLASNEILARHMTIGDLVLINALLLQIVGPLNFLSMAYREIRNGLTDMEALFALQAQVVEVRDAENAKELKRGGREVRFEDVSFAYDEERPILRDLTFEIPAGKKYAIVGMSGSGKTTVSRLLIRLFDVHGGKIMVDGQDIRLVTQDSLRRAVGFVPQDPTLFNDTVRFNIAIGAPAASQDALERVARLAQIHDFIQALPDGYDTIVGERGVKLSGGERQRLAIARALMVDPPIVVFDEATSALDTKTERALHEAIEGFSRGRTTIIIAHRMSTVVNADAILVLHEGRILERGSHTELLEARGAYAALWEAGQFDGNAIAGGA